ncbi:MAG: hypothetical protein ACRCWI_08695 [Brevinema sp.]
MATINSDHPTGLYECLQCGQTEKHTQGTSKAPCSTCGHNDRWKLLRAITR